MNAHYHTILRVPRLPFHKIFQIYFITNKLSVYITNYIHLVFLIINKHAIPSNTQQKIHHCQSKTQKINVFFQFTIQISCCTNLRFNPSTHQHTFINFTINHSNILQTIKFNNLSPHHFIPFISWLFGRKFLHFCMWSLKLKQKCEDLWSKDQEMNGMGWCGDMLLEFDGLKNVDGMKLVKFLKVCWCVGSTCVVCKDSYFIFNFWLRQ